MKTNPNHDLNDLSLEELLELLIEKTTELLNQTENGIEGTHFKNLLLQVEQINKTIKNKRKGNFS